MPPPIVALAREMLRNPVTINLERTAAPAVGITQAVYPVAAGRSSLAAAGAAEARATMKSALVFTRTKHRANRLADFLGRHGVACERIHGNRSQAQRTAALAGFKSGRFRVLVATDIAARGIDVEALEPRHQLRRAGRARGLHPPRRPHGARGGDRATPSPSSRRRRRATRAPSSARSGKRLPRVTLPEFDYAAADRGDSSRCRWRSASRRSAPARPRTAPARRPTPSAAPSIRAPKASGAARLHAPHGRPGQPSRSWQGRPSGSAPSPPSRPGPPQRSWPGQAIRPAPARRRSKVARPRRAASRAGPQPVGQFARRRQAARLEDIGQ